MPRGHVVPNGNRVAALRGEAALTQWELARLAGFGLRTIGKIETGARTSATTLSAVATVLERKLQRRIALGDLLCKPDESAGRFLLAEVVKLLNLRSCAESTASEPRAVLHDRWRFRRMAEQVHELVLPYESVGHRLHGRCLSHPDTSEWLTAPGRDMLASTVPACLRHGMRIRLPEGTDQQGCDIHNQIEYLDGFGDGPRDGFHAHVSYPTENLTLIIWFPDDRPCRLLTGWMRRDPTGFQTAVQQPLSMMDGRFAYWHITAPQIGETYRIEWEW